MPAAVLSKGTAIRVKVGATFTKVSGFTNFDGIGGGSPAVIDATDLDSTAKEKLAGIPDEGSIKLDFNFIPTDAGQAALLTARGTQATTSFELQVGLTRKAAFDGFVKTWAPSTGVDKTIALAVEVEITGPVVWTTVTP